MNPDRSTPRNRRIDEHILQSLKQRNLMSSVQDCLDGIGIAQNQYKSPIQVRREQDRLEKQKQSPFKHNTSSGIIKNVHASPDDAQYELDSQNSQQSPHADLQLSGNNDISILKQLVSNQDAELASLKAKNQQLIDLIQSSKLLNPQETKEESNQCTENSSQLYEISNADDKSEIKQLLLQQSQKINIQSSQIVELSQQLNKQKEYEQQLIDELMKMQQLTQQGDNLINLDIVKSQSEQNKNLQQQNFELQAQLAELQTKSQKVDHYKQKYDNLKQKFIELQSQARELNEILMNEQKETQNVIKDLVKDIESLKTQAQKRTE